MPAFFAVMTPAQVVDAQSFARYANQVLGTPLPRGGREIATLKKKLAEFFEVTPEATWFTLATTVDWCRAKRRRPALAWGVLASVRWAWSDHALPELDPVERRDDWVESSITQALTVETDEWWRRMLIGCCGTANRKEALGLWLAHH